MINLAPVAVFAFNRPVHLRNLLLSLSANINAELTSVVVFLDGPRNDYDRQQQAQILNVLQDQYPFKSLSTVVSVENKGLARSIRSGVTQLLVDHPRLIVLEDDLILSPSFLEFMNQGLEIYENRSEVASIHGFQYPVKEVLREPVFFRGADCWGWATWSDRWDQVSFDAQKLLDEIRDSGLIDAFNLSGGMDFYGMLQRQANGEVDSWAICWHASMFLQNKLTLYPPSSLVQNRGNDGSGIHSGVNDIFETELINSDEWQFPTKIEESVVFRNLLSAFYKSSLGRKNIIVRVYAKTKKICAIIKSIFDRTV